MASDLLNWNPQAFESCYNAIKFLASVPQLLDSSIGPDLRALLTVPSKNEKSRSTLAAGETGKPVVLLNGDEYKFNKPFLAATSSLSVELDLDELACAELLEVASSALGKEFDLVDAGRLAFIQRYEYILNIAGHLVTTAKLSTIIKQNQASTMLSSIIASFKKIYSLLQIQNDLIDKQKATGDLNDVQFVDKIVFMKNKLFLIHGLLAQVLFSIVDKYILELGNFESYSSIVSHINESVKDDSDILLLHYLPSLMRIISSLSDLPDDQVSKLHLNFVSALSSDYSKVNSGEIINLENSSIRTYVLVLQLFFFIAMIPWCKDEETRTKKYDFEKDILKYVEWLISYGTLEQLLCYAAESATPETKVLYERRSLYDFRPLLQRNFPSLKPVKLIYSGNEELSHIAKSRPELTNMAILCDYLSFEISNEFSNQLLAPFFHSFFSDFINHAAIVLSLLRDSEEDFLLSSMNRKQLELASDDAESKTEEDINTAELSKRSNDHDSKTDGNSLDLESIASRGELDRFYLAFAFTYTHRPDLCNAFWTGDEANIAGFINWGLANNTSPLITATFCLLLASLTSAGEIVSAKVWEFLINAQGGSIKRNDYSKVSVDSILHSLTYYVDSLTENLEHDLNLQTKQQQRKLDILFSNPYTNKKDNELKKSVSIQLSEDSVIFISGFLMLISAIVKNANKNSPLSRSLRQSAFNCFLPVIIGFLKFDNLIISAKSAPTDDKVIPVVFNDENRTIIINLILNLLADFAENEQNLDLRFKIWNTLDRWICHSLHDLDTNNSAPSDTTRYAGVSLSTTSLSSGKNELSKLRTLHRGINMKSGLQMSLNNISEVINFVLLLKNLLTPLESGKKALSSIQLLYPSNLGFGHRHKNQIGVWPYIEYLIVEVFAKTPKLKQKEHKLILQDSIIFIIQSALGEVDWPFVNNVAPHILLDLPREREAFAQLQLVSDEPATLSYTSFVKLHHSVAVLNYMFDENASKALLDIINIGAETINLISSQKFLVKGALEALNSILALQDTFIEGLLPILKNTDNGSPPSTAVGYGTSLSLALAAPKTVFDNIYYPSNLGTKGVSSYYEILLFHIPSIVNIALYVGSSELEIADSALEIIRKLSLCSLFVSKSNNIQFLRRNRLLDIFNSIDESFKIQYGFTQQIATITDQLSIKFKILKYLLSNMNGINEVSVSHFLLGFDIKDSQLVLDQEREADTLLLSLVELLISTLNMISEVDYSQGYSHHIGLGPAKLTSMIMEIFVRLCQDPISSTTTLNFLRKYDLFAKLLSAQLIIDDMTTWENYKFNGVALQGSENAFLFNESSCETFFSFIKYRNAVLQYLSTEFHATNSLYRKEYYVSLLLDGSEFLDGTPKILNFLDLLNFRFCNFDDHKLEQFNGKYNMRYLLMESVKDKEEGNQDLVIKKLVKLSCQVASHKFPTEDSKAAFVNEITTDFSHIEDFLVKFNNVSQLKTLQLKSLHSWVQFIQVVTYEGVINKTDFIFNVFQIILPKVNNEYYERDILLAEELISLCVFLFELYEQENKLNLGEENSHYLQRLLPLFKTCVSGVLCLNSTATLRSDLYLLLNKCIQRSIKAETSLRQIVEILRSIDKKFIDIVCNDSIYSEGTPRITSLVFMESLIHLSCMEKSTTILEALTRNNSLSLLVRSLKRTDEIIVACDVNGDEKQNSGINIDTLLYELTALKSTLYLLIRIAQTRQGAAQLFQHEIFSVIKQLKFLAIDADLGIDLIIDCSEDISQHKHENARIKLSLDVPVALGQNSHVRDEGRLVSYYEFLVPTFQLIATMLLSMGSSYKPGVEQVKELMKHFHRFIVGVMKRDALLEDGQAPETYEDISYVGLQEIVRLLSLIDAVIEDDQV